MAGGARAGGGAVSAAPEARRAGRRQFLLVAAAFLGTPLLAALWYAYGDAGHHGDTVNRGTLIDPPRPVTGAEALGLLDRWSLVVVAPAGCQPGCERALVTLRQVRLTFGDDLARLGLVLVSGAPGDAARLAADHPALRVLDPTEAGALAAAVAGIDGGAAEGRAFVVDPLGNAMLSYAPGFAPADVGADLKRLLRNSSPWMRR